MTFDWYRLFSLPEFLATGLVSRTLTVTLEGLGEKSILLSRGNVVGVTYEDTFLPLGAGGKNPSVRGDYAIYRDADDFVWLGILTEEEEPDSEPPGDDEGSEDSVITRSSIAPGLADAIIVNDSLGRLSSTMELPASRIGSGIFPVERGGTGLSALGAALQLLRVNAGATAYEFFTHAFGPVRNFIINGGFDFWQRGTSFATAANGQYSADRFRYSKVNTTAVHTVSRSTDVPTLSQSGFQSTYSILVDCTTADASVASTDYVALSYRVEGYDYAQLKNRTVTLNFWVKATKTGTYCVAFRNSGADRSYVTQYTVSAADTWEEKNITLTLNPSGGTDDFVNGIGLFIDWVLMAGSTYQTTAGAWQTGDVRSTSSQVNASDDTANNFRLNQVQLTIGAVAPDEFSRAGHTIRGEMLLCERYYEKSYSVDTNPGTVTDVGRIRYRSPLTGTFAGSVFFRSKKRAVPTMTYYSNGTGASGQVRDNSAAADVAATTTDAGDSNASLTFAATDANSYSWHYVADAEP